LIVRWPILPGCGVRWPKPKPSNSWMDKNGLFPFLK
jgi:hypothetical protein